MKSQLIVLTGRKFGRWTVLHKGPIVRPSAVWTCQCECGTVRNVDTLQLRRGKSLSCGCLQKDKAKARRKARAILEESFPLKKKRVIRPVRGIAKKVNGTTVILHAANCNAMADDFISYNFTPTGVSSCCRGEVKRHRGFSFSYL